MCSISKRSHEPCRDGQAASRPTLKKSRKEERNMGVSEHFEHGVHPELMILLENILRNHAPELSELNLFLRSLFKSYPHISMFREYSRIILTEV